MSVFSKLQDARIKLQNTALKKSGLNKFAGFQYFELGDFLPTVQVIFSELKLSSTINFGASEATLLIVDTEDNSKTSFTCPVVVPTMKGCNEIQALGAMMTYIRRYLYVNALEIVEHDAIDATSGKDDKVKGVIHKPTKDITFNPDADEETFLLLIVDGIVAAKNDIDTATDLFYGQNLDNDQKVWIWDKLGKESALRSAMKKHHQSNEDK